MKEIIRQIMRERMIDEMTGSGAAGDYATPYAFGKKGNEKAKGKKQASLTGYSVVSEEYSDKIPNLKLTDIAPNKSVDAKSEKKKYKEMADVSDSELVIFILLFTYCFKICQLVKITTTKIISMKYI